MTLAEKDVQRVFVDGWSLLIILYIYSLYKNSVFALKISVLDLVNFIKYPINISLFFCKNPLLILLFFSFVHKLSCSYSKNVEVNSL